MVQQYHGTLVLVNNWPMNFKANKRVVLNVYLGRPSTVNKIMIKFALRPKKFEIFFLRLNRAESYYKYE